MDRLDVELGWACSPTPAEGGRLQAASLPYRLKHILVPTVNLPWSPQRHSSPLVHPLANARPV